MDYVYILCNIYVKEHLPEYGHNSWPKHVAGYALYNAINLLICIYTCRSSFSHWNISACSCNRLKTSFTLCQSTGRRIPKDTILHTRLAFTNMAIKFPSCKGRSAYWLPWCLSASQDGLFRGISWLYIDVICTPALDNILAIYTSVNKHKPSR